MGSGKVRDLVVVLVLEESYMHQVKVQVQDLKNPPQITSRN
jgi:hypothetical protein